MSPPSLAKKIVAQKAVATAAEVAAVESLWREGSPGRASHRQRGRGQHPEDLRRFRNPLHRDCGDHRDGQRGRHGGLFSHRGLIGGTLMRHGTLRPAPVTLLPASVAASALERGLIAPAGFPGTLGAGSRGARLGAVDIAAVAVRADRDERTATGAEEDPEAFPENRRLPRQHAGQGERFLRYSTWVERRESPQYPWRPWFTKNARVSFFCRRSRPFYSSWAALKGHAGQQDDKVGHSTANLAAPRAAGGVRPAPPPKRGGHRRVHRLPSVQKEASSPPEDASPLGISCVRCQRS